MHLLDWATNTIESNIPITLDILGLTDVSRPHCVLIESIHLTLVMTLTLLAIRPIRSDSTANLNKRLTDYIEVKTNRVLLVDDIANDFRDTENLRTQNPYIDFNIITDVYTSGVIQVRNPFTDQVQLSEIITLSYDNNAFTLSKASVFDSNEEYGEFSGVA